jgi:hypothetical protein
MSGSLLASSDPASGAGAWRIVYSGPGVVTGLSCPSISSCFAVDSAGDVLAAGPGLTSAQIRVLLLQHLVPVGNQANIVTVLEHDGYSFFFTGPSAGHLSIAWLRMPTGAHLASNAKTVLIAAATQRLADAGRVRIKVKLTARGQRLLASAHTLKLIAKATFAPRGGPGITALATFTLRR